MEHKNPETSELRTQLEDLSCTVDLLYVPGHKDIAGNEMAYKYAKEAAGSERDYAENSISFKAAKSIIKQEVKDGPITHIRTAACYANFSHKKDRLAVKSRKDAALLAQLRSGHCLKLGAYEHRIKPDHKSEFCVRCKRKEPDDLEHWLQRCDQTLAARQKIFGEKSLSLEEMGKSPYKILQLARMTL